MGFFQVFPPKKTLSHILLALPQNPVMRQRSVSVITINKEPPSSGPASNIWGVLPARVTRGHHLGRRGEREDPDSPKQVPYRFIFYLWA